MDDEDGIGVVVRIFVGVDDFLVGLTVCFVIVDVGIRCVLDDITIGLNVVVFVCVNVVLDGVGAFTGALVDDVSNIGRFVGFGLVGTIAGIVLTVIGIVVGAIVLSVVFVGFDVDFVTNAILVVVKGLLVVNFFVGLIVVLVVVLFLTKSVCIV